MRKILISLVLILVGISTARAEKYSMRDCMLLPITDNIGDAMAFKVYEEIENYLRTNGWCSYKPSSELLNVFSKYREKLDQHLEDPAVLVTVADKLQVGSMIKIKMTGTSDSVTLEVKIFGENGRDMYLSEKAVLNKVDLFLVNQTIKNWLELYEAVIPYDGKVLGVLGDQVSFKVGNRKDFKVGQVIITKKLVNKKEHPLLQKIVAWETIDVAKGKITNISYDQGLATLSVYMSRDKVIKGNWIKISTEESQAEFPQGKEFDESQQYSFGRLGELELTLDYSNTVVGVSKKSGNIKYGNNLFGVTAELETWITREYFLIGEFSRRLGSLESVKGKAELDSPTVTAGHYKVGAGYKYLPMGYFYGPQVNFIIGYANYLYDLEESEEDFVSEGSISGFFVGAGGSLPIQKGLRIYGKGEVIPFSEFDRTDDVYPKAKSSGSMAMEVGVKYQYSPVMKFVGGMEIINNSARFKSSKVSEINYKDNIFKMGVNYTF